MSFEVEGVPECVFPGVLLVVVPDQVQSAADKLGRSVSDAFSRAAGRLLAAETLHAGTQRAAFELWPAALTDLGWCTMQGERLVKLDELLVDPDSDECAMATRPPV